MKGRSYLILTFATWFLFCFLPQLVVAAAYDLNAVRGIEGFGGSAEARELLARNSFVVADPAFKQIFEPYIRSPRIEKPSQTHRFGESLPSFITTDSAWHTYHVLLEEGVKEMEEIQSQRLLKFSRLLWAAAQRQGATADAKDLILFASVGLALQDEQHRKSLTSTETRIVDGLRTGEIPVDVPIGFPLAPTQFRAQSFYTQSSELSDYFAARQWYASVVFRLSNARETRMAIALATLVNGDAELLNSWKQLSEPFDTFLATAEDGTIGQYIEIAKLVVGPNSLNNTVSETQLREIQKRLQERLALPRISDQVLTPQQYSQFGHQTRGFRLLPPRRLPCAVCFHNTTDPIIPGRRYPSGLDFLAASPALRSPAAARAVESQFGKSVGELILKADCGPMPDSLHGEAMQLLGLLQKPLPPEAPASMQSAAWSDLQLWTQLGAWAEQRHTWALHTKLTVNYAGAITPPKGMVAPYPEFFSGLAALTRRTAAALESAGLGQQFSVQTVASNLLESLIVSEKVSRFPDEKHSARLEQLRRFQNSYYTKHKEEIEKDGTRSSLEKLDDWNNIQNELKEMASRCAAMGEASEKETETLRSFFDCRQNTTLLLTEFIPVCERLAALAKKPLMGQALSEDDSKWIENYGVTLARFHFYFGNSYEVPLDNFPIVTRVFSNPLTDSMLYAGLARPQALYVIAPDGNTNQLYRGAVMTYREFVRPSGQLLDDDSWRGLISKGQTPPTPPFTASFCAETSAAELIKKLEAQSTSRNFNFGDIRDTLFQITSRATTNDLPALLNLLVASTNAPDSVTPDIAEVIGNLDWDPYRANLVTLLAAPDSILADSAAQILLERPGSLDCKPLISNFDLQSSRTRRLYCVLLSGVVQQNDAARDLLLRAMQDADDGVRWQAVLGIAKTNRNDERSTAALVGHLEDPNQFVAAAAVHSLVQLGATNAAPMLLTKLVRQLGLTNETNEARERQARAIKNDMEHSHRPGGYSSLPTVLDPDDLGFRIDISVSLNARKAIAGRFPPPQFTFPTHGYCLVDALIEGLGGLRYVPAADELFKLRGTDYDAGGTRALCQIVPERLTAELLATATDKQIDSYVRERALVTLCHLSLTNRIRDIAPLLEDTTPITYDRPLPGPEWRICDRAAASIALMLGWEHETMLRYMPPQKREDLLKRAREWAKSMQ